MKTSSMFSFCTQRFQRVQKWNIGEAFKISFQSDALVTFFQLCKEKQRVMKPVFLRLGKLKGYEINRLSNDIKTNWGLQKAKNVFRIKTATTEQFVKFICQRHGDDLIDISLVFFQFSIEQLRHIALVFLFLTFDIFFVCRMVVELVALFYVIKSVVFIFQQ